MMGWESFSVAMLGAAAVLVGLIFVALSVNMQQVLRYPWLVSRAGESILWLVAVLIACAFLLVPGLSIEVLGVGLVLLGVLGVVVVAGMGIRRRQEIEPEFRRTADIQLATGVAALSLFVPAGVSLMLGTGGGLYWLVPATLSCMVLSMVNAWVLQVEINR